MVYTLKLYRAGLHFKKIIQLLFISIFLVCALKRLLSSLYNEAIISGYFIKNVFSKARLPYCFKDGDIDKVDKGEWITQKGLTNKDYIRISELDKFIRMSMDWAPILHRRDRRCGVNAPIPGYRLLAQCDPLSDYPCCNLNTGLCDSGPSNCNCRNCTNFQIMVSAELAKWQPKKCRLREFTWKDSCRLLLENSIKLYFTGDSLVRHLHTTALLHLSNNYEEGAIPQNASEKVRQQCAGILQITKKECSVEKLAQSVDELRPGTVCPGFTPSTFTVEQTQDYHITLIPEVKDKISSLINQENTWIIGGVGLHYQLDIELLKREYLNKVLALLRSSHNGWPKFLWVEIHGYSGYIRQKSGPHMKAIKTFNTILGSHLKKHGIPVIRTFEMSKEVRSYDGRHHGLALNQLKLDLIFNFISQFYDKKKSISP